MTIKELLQKIENTYSDSEYVNVVGTESDMQNFAKECENAKTTIFGSIESVHSLFTKELDLKLFS